MAQHPPELSSSEKSTYRCVGVGNGNDRHRVPRNGPVQPPQAKPRFVRRRSISSPVDRVASTELGCNELSKQNGPGNQSGDSNTDGVITRSSGPSWEGGKPRNNPNYIEKVVARICGPSRSKCGYCNGKRLHVLGLNDAYNKCILADSTKPNHHDDRDESARAENKQPEQVDDAKTSKSYGLLFDFLPYGTYEDLINHGWRRSGKHLYRPHNFESCCPAISIRLDVLKFVAGTSLQTSNTPASRFKGSDIAGAILVKGSKSQRKVGKSVLRALELYNSKCNRGYSSLLNNNSDHALREAKIQIGESVSGVTGPVRHDTDCCQSEPRHQHKKLRKRSPDRDIEKLMDKSSNMDQIQNKSAVSTKIAKTPTSSECLQLFLDKISGLIYQTITNEAIKAAASSEQCDADGNFMEKNKPGWAWWKDNGTIEGSNIPKWCSFKLAQPKGGPKHQRSASLSSTSLTLTASTSACAAASGRSRGVVDRGQLVRSVVDSLKRSALYTSQKDEEGSIEQQHCVKEVKFHEKSGHVHVKLETNASTKSIPSKYSDLPKKSSLASKQKQMSHNADEVDPITEFIERHATIEQRLKEPRIQPSNQRKKRLHQKRILTIQSVPAHTSSLQPEVHQLFCRYQTAVHGDLDPFFGEAKEKDDDHDYVYYRQKNPPGFLDIDVAYGHLDEIRRSKIKTSYLTFYRFLCETPVTRDEVSSIEKMYDEDGYDIHISFGTYHQQYRLSTSKDAFDGPLLAVGVADILPHCFSSVYAFYDPILSNSLELGKYTALREIEWVHRASKFRPELHYYYLGYYIHSCQKMTYKAEYKPSELLCPVNLKWVDFEEGKKRLEERSPIRHCCALVSDASLSLPKEESTIDSKPKLRIEDISLDIGDKEPQIVQVGMLNRQGREFIDPHVNEFVAEVGADICSKFVIKLR